jgi:ABC-type antimicrobial peptide transport system permease subunit
MEYAHLIMLAVLIVAVVAGITNTMMTSVFERLREFGMLLGLGLRPRGIVRMLFAEAAVLGVMGAALGTSLGLAAVLGMAAGGGVDLMGLEKSGAEFAFGGIAMPSMVVPRVVVWNYVTGLVAVVATSLLSALWPASHAARLEPVEALRS